MALTYNDLVCYNTAVTLDRAAEQRTVDNQVDNNWNIGAGTAGKVCPVWAWANSSGHAKSWANIWSNEALVMFMFLLTNLDI